MNHISDPGQFLEKIRFEGIQGNEEVKISLFVVSKKVYRLKEIDLAKLTREQGSRKLLQWSQEYRFVAVIETGDQIYAHASERMAKQLEEKGVGLNDKKVIVKTLSDEEYDQLASVVQAFGEYLLAQSVNKEENDQAVTEESSKSRKSSAQQDLVENRFLDKKMEIQGTIGRLINTFFHRAISTILSHMAETRRELDEQRKREDIARYIKAEAIGKETLKKDIEKEGIKKEEIGRVEAHQVS